MRFLLVTRRVKTWEVQGVDRHVRELALDCRYSKRDALCRQFVPFEDWRWSSLPAAFAVLELRREL